VQIVVSITVPFIKNVLIPVVRQINCEFLRRAVQSLEFIGVGSDNVSAPGQRLGVCQT
jgi:hypothetical protein